MSKQPTRGQGACQVLVQAGLQEFLFWNCGNSGSLASLLITLTAKDKAK